MKAKAVDRADDIRLREKALEIALARYTRPEDDLASVLSAAGEIEKYLRRGRPS